MAQKALGFTIVAGIVLITLFLLETCESNGGGLSPLASKERGASRALDQSTFA